MHGNREIVVRLRHDDPQRVELPASRKRAKQCDFRPSGSSPFAALGPVQDDGTMPPPREPVLFNMSLPVRTVRVHEQQVLALNSPNRSKTSDRAPLPPLIPDVSPYDKGCKHRYEDEKTAPETHSPNHDGESCSDSPQPDDHRSTASPVRLTFPLQPRRLTIARAAAGCKRLLDGVHGATVPA